MINHKDYSAGVLTLIKKTGEGDKVAEVLLREHTTYCVGHCPPKILCMVAEVLLMITDAIDQFDKEKLREN